MADEGSAGNNSNIKYPRILVGAPVCKHYEYCFERYVDALKNLDYLNYEVLLVDNSDDGVFFEKARKMLEGTRIKIIRAGNDEPSIKMKMVICRNILREKALNDGFDYFFNLDQDVLPPLDVLKKLVGYGKDIITGIYDSDFVFDGRMRAMPIIYGKYSDSEILKLKAMTREELKAHSLDLYKALEDNNWDFNDVYKQFGFDDIAGNGLVEIKMCGTGCIMVSRKAMERMAFRYNQNVGFDDSLFCKEAVRLGFNIYAECSVVCRHLAREKPWNWCNVGNEQMILYGANMFKRKEYGERG